MVRINDRGPVTKGRILDLSYGAATILGMEGDGIAKVRLDLIETSIMATNFGSQLIETGK
jgi:rare lipoprotein A